MGWGRYFLLGDIGQQLDIQDRQRELDGMRNQLESQWSRDQNQDAQIETLRRENQELKLYVAGIVRLLQSKNVVSAEDIRDLVGAVDPEPRSGRR
jgi:hypothetical protein